MRFEKWQALGNDYVIVERDALPFELTAGRVRALCAHHTGVGSDGVLLISPPEAVTGGGGDPATGGGGDPANGGASDPAAAGAVARLQIFNPDGSEAELSGNGAREAALYLHRHGRAGARSFAIQTAAGAVQPEITSDTTCRMALGRARTRSPDYPAGPEDGAGELEAAGRRWSFRHVQVGNPQCAIRLRSPDELEALDLARYGPAIVEHPLFPNRTNVSWYAPIQGGRIRARIFERGAGETTASGTGAAGAAVAHLLAGGRSPVTVVLDGGELEVEADPSLNVTLSGWAVPVYSGTLAADFLEELAGRESD